MPFPAGAWTQQFPALEPGAAIRLPLWLDAAEAPSGMVYSLLRIQSDIGTEVYIPVTAYKEDLN